MTPLGAFARADLHAMARDPLLRSLLVAPIAMSGVLVAGIPLVERWLAAAHDLDLADHRPVAVAFLAGVVMPMFFGAMGGLLILEDRESGILPAVAVSPVGLRRLLLVRCLWAGLAAAVTTGAALLLYGSAPATAAAAALLSGGCAGVVVLLVGSLAADRLEGMAVVKALTLPLALALLTEMVSAPWSWALVVLPSYTPVAALLHGARFPPATTFVAGTTEMAPLVLLGVVQLGLWTWLLQRRLARHVG